VTGQFSGGFSSINNAASSASPSISIDAASSASLCRSMICTEAASGVISTPS
jgi:hypothetical protein